MLNGETIASGAADCCPDCRVKLELQVLQSNAGYYIGTFCDCGPYSRESGYYSSRETAQTALDSGQFGRGNLYDDPSAPKRNPLPI